MQYLSVFLHGSSECTQAQVFHEKNISQTGAQSHKKPILLHCIASYEVNCPKTAGQQQYVRSAIPC